MSVNDNCSASLVHFYGKPRYQGHGSYWPWNRQPDPEYNTWICRMYCVNCGTQTEHYYGLWQVLQNDILHLQYDNNTMGYAHVLRKFCVIFRHQSILPRYIPVKLPWDISGIFPENIQGNLTGMSVCSQFWRPRDWNIVLCQMHET